MSGHAASVARLDLGGLAALIRPRIAVLVLVVAFTGYCLERPAGFGPLPGLLVGTLLCAAAGCALNHYLERDADARMERTRRRPLVTGALSERQVLAGSAVCLAVGLPVLALSSGAVAVGFQVTALALYLGVYTPLKRRTSSNTWVGALPGALPLLVGAAAAGGPSSAAWAAFALVFLWQLPHFFAIASMYREQYASGGMRMLANEDPDDALLRWQMPLQVMSVMLVSIVPVLIGSAGFGYGLLALGLGALFLLTAFAFRARPDRARARRVVVASVIYLPLVLVALTVDVACASGGGDEMAACCEDDEGHDGAHDAPGGAATAAADETGLPDHGALPEFSLVDDSGSTFTLKNLKGDVWVVDFIFTRCAVTCGQMSEVYAQLIEEDLPTRFLSVTVDPRNDGPPQLRAYRARYGADASEWKLLTGTSQDIQYFAEVGFRLPVNAGAEEVAGMPPLFHSGKFALVDADGRVRGYYDYRDELEVERLRTDIGRLAAVAGDAAGAAAPR